MNCEKALPLLRDYTDGELMESQRPSVEAHLAECTECSRRVSAERELKALIRGRLRPKAAPDDLTRAVLAATTGRPRLRSWRSSRALIGAASACLLGAGIWMLASRGPSALAASVVDDHIRFLGEVDAAQIKTGVRIEAERWFSRQLDIFLPLPRFDGRALRLRGGRLCNVMDRRVALLFYEHEGRRASLFVMNGKGLDPGPMDVVAFPDPNTAIEIHKGFQVLCWKHEGLLYALVSDAGQERLVQDVSAAYRL
jgi:anti-sigma factor (TIGR02949 family)